MSMMTANLNTARSLPLACHQHHIQCQEQDSQAPHLERLTVNIRLTPLVINASLIGHECVVHVLAQEIEPSHY